MRGGNLRRTLLQLVVVALFMQAPAAARAEDDPETALASSRPFVIRLAGSVGIPLELADAVEDSRAYQDFDELAGAHTSDEPSIGFHGALGYRFFDDHIAVLAHVEHLTNLEVTFDDGVRGSPEAGRSILEGDTWALSADVEIHPWTGRVQPFVVAGVGWLWADLEEKPIRASAGNPGTPDPEVVKLGLGIDSGDGFMARFGGGVEFYLTDYFFFHADASYVLGTGDVDDLDYISVGWGLGCRF